MANTYYNYVNREVESQVNWAEIGKSMTDMLSNEAKAREEKKAALDQATRDQLKVLSNPPTGENESARVMGIKFGDSASQYLRMQDQLLKSGQLKLSDYMVGRQNIIDDTDNLFGMLKDYQATYKEKMDRRNADENQEWELAAMEIIEGFGNFSKSQAYIDPATGRVSMAMMEKKVINGKDVYVLSDKPNKTASITTVKGLLQGKWDKFNTDAALDGIKARLGENLQTIRKFGKNNVAGEIMSVNDVLASVRDEAAINADITDKQNKIKALEGKTDKKSIDDKAQLEKEIKETQTELAQAKAIFDFAKWENKSIEMNFTNEWNRLSVLTNSMGNAPDGNPYNFVYTAQEQAADPVHNIYMKPADDNSGSLIPEFTKEQKKDSLDFMRNQLRGRYDYKESRQTVNEYQRPDRKSEWERNADEERKYKQTVYKYWNDLRSGTAQEKAAALQWLNGSDYLLDKNIEEIGYEDGGNGVTLKFGATATTPAYETTLWLFDKEGHELSGEQWMASGNLAGGGNVSTADAKKFGVGERTWDESQVSFVDGDGNYYLDEKGKPKRVSMRSSISKTGAGATGIVTSGY